MLVECYTQSNWDCNSQMRQLLFVGRIRRQTLLYFLPDVIAGLVGRFKELPGLIGYVLQIAYQRRTVVAGLEMLQNGGIVSDPVGSGGKHVRQLLLKFSTRQWSRRIGLFGVLRGHMAASLKSASGVRSG